MGTGKRGFSMGKLQPLVEGGLWLMVLAMIMILIKLFY